MRLPPPLPLPMHSLIPCFQHPFCKDWLIPQLAIDPREDDSETLGVAGTTLYEGREIDESFDLGMSATEGSVPKKVSTFSWKSQVKLCCMVPLGLSSLLAVGHNHMC